MAQNDSFSETIQGLQSEASKNTKCKLLKLSPFIDSEGLLCVGSRLKHADLPFDSKHPLILSGKKKSEHRRLFHAGPQLLLTTVRQRYWPTAGMNVAKKIVRTYVTCFKAKPTSIYPIMAHLPRERVTIMNPFNVSGVDYAGPFQLK